MVMGRDVSASAVIKCAKPVKIDVMYVSKIQGFNRHNLKFMAAAKQENSSPARASRRRLGLSFIVMMNIQLFFSAT
jgi:hypothetical protein